MAEDRIARLQDVLSAFWRFFQVPISLWDMATEQQFRVTEGFSPDPALHYLRPAFETGAVGSYLLHRHEMLYGLVHDGESDTLILIGPVRTDEFTDKDIALILRDLGESVSRRQEFRVWLKKSPGMNRAQFVALLSFFIALLKSENTEIVSMDPADVKNDWSPFAAVKRQEVFHNTELLEREVLDAITVGDSSRLLDMLMAIHNSDAAAGQFPGGAVRTVKTLFITAVSLCSRAAVSGGMEYDQALTISDHYIQKVEGLRTLELIVPQFGIMMLDLSDRVARLRAPKGASPLTQQVLSYVHAHLHEPIVLETIAAHTAYSVSYISHTFSHDMGKSVQSYIREQKINEAKRFLVSEEHSIAEIAAILGYSSQPLFQTSFRKITGMTPMQYKNSQRTRAQHASRE